MSWFKKGPLLSLLGGLLILWALVFFFFDPMLKFALVRGGQAATGAKVEIASVRSKWLKGNLEVRGIAVADRSAPMKNLFELSRAAFRLDLGAALRGKSVVREATLEGLLLGTARRSSGALPKPPPPSKLESMVRSKIAPVGQASLAKLGEIKSGAVGQVDSAKLAGLKKYDEAKAKAKDIEDRWKGKSEEAKAIEKEAKEIAEQVKSIGGGSDILKKAAQVRQVQERIKALIARVDAQRVQAQKDLAEAQDALKQAEELRKKDLNGLLAEAGLPTLDSQDLAKRLLGEQTAARLSTALKWMRLAREKAAAKKAAAPPPPARRRGIDVEFRREHVYPQFLLEGAKISGKLEGLFMGKDMALAGLLSGVTSNPKLYGKPATLDLSGNAEGASLKLSARLDQQDDPVGVAVKFEGSGFSLAGAALGDGEVGGAIRDGRAKVSGELRSAGEEWKGEVLMEASGVSLEPKVTLPGTAGALVSDALRSLKTFNVRVGISGKENDLKLAFSSNAGDAISGALKKAVSGQLAAQRKTLESKLEALYGGKANDAQAQVAGLTGKLMGPLDAQRSALDRQLKEAAGKALGGPKLPAGLNKLFK